MARRKVKLAFIANDSSRKASFRKRKNGLLKKMKELSTLCDVTVTAIIYNPGEAQPEIWPPSVSEVNAALSKFREMPEMNQRKKMMDQERFLMQRIVKVGEQYKKQARDNREKEVVLAMYGNLDGTLGLDGMTGADLDELSRVIDKTLADIHDDTTHRQRQLINNKQPVVEEELMPPPAPATSMPFTGLNQMEGEIKSVDQYMHSQPYWSIDLMNLMMPPPPPPPPPHITLPPPPTPISQLYPPKLLQPQTVGEYYLSGGDCSYIGDQQNVMSMFPLFGDRNNNFNATSSSTNSSILWPNNNTSGNLFYP